MVHGDDDVVRLIKAYANARSVSDSTASLRATGSGDTVSRIGRGMSLTFRRAARIVRWLSDNWPTSTEWPADIPRPTPQPPGAAASQPAAPAPASPREAVRAARARRDEAAATGDWAAVERWQGEAVAAAMKLDERGQILDATALCQALAVRRYIYDDVVRRYIGRPERRPRPGRSTARVVEALRAAGDVRFTQPRPQEAA